MKQSVIKEKTTNELEDLLESEKARLEKNESKPHGISFGES